MTTPARPYVLEFGEYSRGWALLPFWNEGSTKQRVLNFVRRVITAGCPQFVQPTERIAGFDDDGTPWSKHLICFQLAFVLDRLKAMAPQHTDHKDTQLAAGVLRAT